MVRRSSLLLLWSFLAWTLVTTGGWARDYYISLAGDDSSPGTQDKPWRSVARVNATRLQPGDRVHFQGGQRFAGTLELDQDDSGAPDQKVVVTSWGDGQATIDGANGSSLRANGCNHLIVRNLRLIGSGRKHGNTQDGLRILDSRGLEIDRIEISGFRGSGLQAEGVREARIAHVYAHDNGAAGISIGYERRSSDLHISHCIARNNPGDPFNLTNHSGNGIVVANAQNAIVEYCEAANNGWDMPRKGNGPVGIWAWNSDRVIIQFCVSHDNKSPGDDGGGFDLDGGATNCILQYNLSYNNDGPGYFLCQFPGAPVFRDNIVRYNISQNDGVKNNRRSGIDIYSASPNASACQVYNNTVYSRHGAAVGFGGLPMPGVVFRNNIFICCGDVVSGEGQRGWFEGNLYWSADGQALSFDGHPSLRAWAEATGQERIGSEIVGRTADPRLTGVGTAAVTDPAVLADLKAYRLTPESPCLAAGMIIKDNGGRDFWGRRVPESQKPAIGACQEP
jgi:hypothetical protein